MRQERRNGTQKISIALQPSNKKPAQTQAFLLKQCGGTRSNLVKDFLSNFIFSTQL